MRKKYLGILTDDELNFLEDALIFYRDSHPVGVLRALDKANNLISKLYIEFWEAPKAFEKPDSLVTNYR